MLFVCTANQLDTIPAPLLDRMEEIRLSGYIAEEKLAIAKNHLWPKLLDRHGAKANQIRINDAAIRLVIDAYSREAGVRGLEKGSVRWCGRPFSKWWRRTQHGSALASERWKKFLVKLASSRSAPNEEGVVTGLAWTAMGGATLSIESSKIHTLNRGFKLTGQLGEVMKESAEIAHSFVVAHLSDFGCESDFFDMSMVHLHVPEGATPKDGPSAAYDGDRTGIAGAR